MLESCRPEQHRICLFAEESVVDLGEASQAARQDEIWTLSDILGVQSRQHPDRVALQEWDGGRLRDTTYGEFKALVDAFSARLREQGVRAHDRVAILMPNGRPWFVAYWSIIGLGAVAVPMEYEYLHSQGANVAFALGHSEARVVVVTCAERGRGGPDDAERVKPIAAFAHAEVMVLEDAMKGAPPVAAEGRPDIAPSAVAQILYTSGTTGRKKGVVLTHANILFDVRACCERFGIRDGDCVPALLPLHHAYPLTTTVVLPLYAGARVPIGDIRSREAADLLREARPTLLIGVPRVFESLLSGVESAARRQGALERLERARRLCGALKHWSGLNAGRFLFRGLHKRLFGGTQLRFCVSGGARLAPGVVAEYLKLGIPILQGWGMTETSPVGAVQPYSARRFYFTRYYEKQAGSIGPPLRGTQIDLIDVPEQNIRVDRDGQGEMVVRGPHVMAEYYKDPEATARVKSDAGLRTGDIARRDAGGNYFIVGRAKHVVVLPGGKKVFPEEDLNEELEGCESIEEFTVRAIRDAGGVEKIGIIIKPNVETLQRRGVATFGELCRVVKDEITAALRDKPDYMKQFDFCLTELRDGEFCDLVKSSMKEPAPLKNEFRFDTAYSTLRDSSEPLRLRTQ